MAKLNLNNLLFFDKILCFFTILKKLCNIIKGKPKLESFIIFDDFLFFRYLKKNLKERIL